MLQYFPTPYKNELWYSVLCRYHIRSGHMNLQMKYTTDDLFLHFPNSGMKLLVEELPEGLFDLRKMIEDHTLLPYFSRIHPRAEKEEVLERLEKGYSLEAGWRNMTRSMTSLRYCPVCRKEEQEIYGESYWHREHQIPFMSVCPTHHCKLITAVERSEWNWNHFLYLPDFFDNNMEPDYDIEPYEQPLAHMALKYLESPMTLSTTDGYNNLISAVAEAGFRKKHARHPFQLDTTFLYRELVAHFGQPLACLCYGKTIPGYMPAELWNWKLLSPRRYILLATLVGQEPETTFGPPLDNINLSRC